MNIIKNFFCLSLAFFSHLSGLSEASEIAMSDKVQVDMNRNGDAVAVWEQKTGHHSIIQANVWMNNWTGSKILSTNSHAMAPKVAVTANHHDIMAVAIWVQIEKGIRSLYASMLLSSIQGWTYAAQISTEHEDVIEPYHIRVNDAGKVIVVWSSIDRSGNHYIRASTSHIDYKNAWSFPTYVSGP